MHVLIAPMSYCICTDYSHCLFADVDLIIAPKCKINTTGEVNEHEQQIIQQHIGVPLKSHFTVRFGWPASITLIRVKSTVVVSHNTDIFFGLATKPCNNGCL